ncbi:MAG: hypothetical protein ONB11_12545 [candidate division KSB1 bacterium]|nr:hypothetical protein [candidate division KSB1 bacterium]
MVNLSARKFYFEINEVDYTTALVEARLNDSAWDESGEIATILEAQLWLPHGGADPLRNSDIQHGAEVIIKVADDSGVISSSGRDRTLYISRLNFEESSQICSLTACDLLTWNNWEEEIDDKDVEEILITFDAFDNGIQHAQLANQFLVKRGFTSGRIDTWSIDYRINYPVSPDTWVSAAREIVASALGYLWVAPDGETEIRQIGFARTPAFHLAIDECDSERLSQEVTPTEKIIAVCNQPIVSRKGPQWSPITGETSGPLTSWDKTNTIYDDPVEVEEPMPYYYLKIWVVMGQYVLTGNGGYGIGEYEWVEEEFAVEYFFYSHDPYEVDSISFVELVPEEVNTGLGIGISFETLLTYLVRVSFKSQVHDLWLGSGLGPSEVFFPSIAVSPEPPESGTITATLQESGKQTWLLSEANLGAFGAYPGWDNCRVVRVLRDGVPVSY